VATELFLEIRTDLIQPGAKEITSVRVDAQGQLDIMEVTPRAFFGCFQYVGKNLCVVRIVGPGVFSDELLGVLLAKQSPDRS
jgi:hypothetical protein